MLGLFAIQEGPWKLIQGQGGGGSYSPDQAEARKTSAIQKPSGQLYNLADDLGETTNRYTEQPEIIARLQALLENIKHDGRSRP